MHKMLLLRFQMVKPQNVIIKIPNGKGPSSIIWHYISSIITRGFCIYIYFRRGPLPLSFHVQFQNIFFRDLKIIVYSNEECTYFYCFNFKQFQT